MLVTQKVSSPMIVSLSHLTNIQLQFQQSLITAIFPTIPSLKTNSWRQSKSAEQNISQRNYEPYRQTDQLRLVGQY